jgi:hypothetical protein
MRFTLRLLNSIFTAAYTVGVVIGVYDFFSENSFKEIRFEDVYVIILFLVYVAGFILSWKREHLAGSIILSWLVLLWTGTGFIFSESDGMALVLGLPALPLGILFLLLGFRRKREEKPEVHQEWAFCLRVLSNLYLILYVVFATSEVMRSAEYNLFAYPDILLLGLFLLFLTGYIFHTTMAHFTGFIFIGWYAMLILVSALIPEIGGDGYLGLYAAIGSTILVQGLFYMNLWYNLKPTKT